MNITKCFISFNVSKGEKAQYHYYHISKVRGPGTDSAPN